MFNCMTQCVKVTRHLCFINSKNLHLLDILTCDSANKPSFQNLTKKPFWPMLHRQLKSVGTIFVYRFVCMIHMHMHKFMYMFIYIYLCILHTYTWATKFSWFCSSMNLDSCNIHIHTWVTFPQFYGSMNLDSCNIQIHTCIYIHGIPRFHGSTVP